MRVGPPPRVPVAGLVSAIKGIMADGSEGPAALHIHRHGPNSEVELVFGCEADLVHVSTAGRPMEYAWRSLRQAGILPRPPGGIMAKYEKPY